MNELICNFVDWFYPDSPEGHGYPGWNSFFTWWIWFAILVAYTSYNWDQIRYSTRGNIIWGWGLFGGIALGLFFPFIVCVVVPMGTVWAVHEILFLKGKKDREAKKIKDKERREAEREMERLGIK